jgi:dUTPase
MANVLWGGQAAAASFFSMAGQVAAVFFSKAGNVGLPRRQQRRTDGAAVRSLLVKVCADSQITNLARHCVKTALSISINNGPMRLKSPRCPLPPPSRQGISFNMRLV